METRIVCSEFLSCTDSDTDSVNVFYKVHEGDELQMGNWNQTSHQELIESLNSSELEYHRPLNVEGEMFFCFGDEERFETSVWLEKHQDTHTHPSESVPVNWLWKEF